MLVSALLLCCSCRSPEKGQPLKEEKEIGYINGVWMSYIEIDSMIKSGNFEKSFDEALEKCGSLHITDIFFHTVPFCDAYYKSDIYPQRGADILDIAVKAAHEKGIRLHAWINPYRVKTGGNDVSSIPAESPAYRWLNDKSAENDKNVAFTETGIYLDPSSFEVRQTVINAVRELCRSHNVDGIHFDDYFYPVPDASFDEKSYSEYSENNETPLSLGDYRRASVNALISGCYTAIKFIDKDILFSVSPAADITKNLESYYADVSSWCQSGCVDILIPQAYFGFCYPIEKFCFGNLLSEWKTVTAGTDTRLCMGLAAYKEGTDASPDCEEWKTAEDIISREAQLCINDKEISGQVFYSYSSLFSDEELHSRCRKNLSAVLDSMP